MCLTYWKNIVICLPLEIDVEYCVVCMCVRVCMYVCM